MRKVLMPYQHSWDVSPAEAAGIQEKLRGLVIPRWDGRRRVKAITASVNADSIAFHRKLGFDVSAPIDGYDRPGAVHVVFTREI